ncbi:MAG: aminotransferase class IV [Pseudomonadota bacterium]
MKIWRNGALVDSAGAVSATDRGFSLGDGVFETLCFDAGRLADFEAHMARLRQGADHFAIPIAYADRTLAEGCGAVVAANALESDRAAIRITLTRGSGPRGLAPAPGATPQILIQASPSSREPPAAARLAVVSIRRNPTSPAARFKTLSYADNILALMEARRLGADDALMLTIDGDAACSPAANFFIIDKDQILTPPLNAGVLPGVVRSRLLELAPTIGLEAAETALALHQVRESFSFLTNSLMGLRRVAAIDGAPCPPASAAFIRLREAFEAVRFD